MAGRPRIVDGQYNHIVSLLRRINSNACNPQCGGRPHFPVLSPSVFAMNDAVDA